MSTRKTIFKEIFLYELFPVLKEIPYRTFYKMPKKFREAQEVYSFYFNLKPINLQNFIKLFLISPRKYEKLGKEGEEKMVEVLQRVEEIRRNCWRGLKEKEIIAFSFALLHIYLAGCREYGIYEVLIDCPPAGFNLESSVPKEKLKTLEKIKKECTKVYEKFDLYEIIKRLMEDIRNAVSRRRNLIRRKYQLEVKRILSYKDLNEMMIGSLLQLLYKHPGIFRFKQPIPKIFIAQVKYIAPPQRYFLFPRKEEKRGELKGVGASAGKVKGRVKICPWVEEALKKIQKGDILVCPKTDPSWMPVLTKVSGVITEVGGLLSHAAIVSRELKIPCIVGVREVFKKLKDGDFIEMNGETGEIKILENEIYKRF